jgi:hypothetical protein
MFKLNNNNNVIFLFVFLLSAVIIFSKIFRSTDSNEDKEILKVIFFNFFKFINARIYINIIFNKKGFQLQKGWLLTLIDLFLLKLINLML